MGRSACAVREWEGRNGGGTAAGEKSAGLHCYAQYGQRTEGTAKMRELRVYNRRSFRLARLISDYLVDSLENKGNNEGRENGHGTKLQNGEMRGAATTWQVKDQRDEGEGKTIGAVDNAE
ncbi:hypothetical protein [Chromobacterium vaccinii]|uniref:hypothetical protein n=1 Tax=Chromobacterium vaccinii TaxID=1108595 RepID=UPI0031D0DB31